MNTPRHAATQFHFGERVTIIPIDRNNPLFRREPAALIPLRAVASSKTVSTSFPAMSPVNTAAS